MTASASDTPSSNSKWSINEVKGDLFSCPDSWSLAHCISRDCRMGKGIALIFKNKFGGVDKLLRQNKRIGDVAVLKQPAEGGDKATGNEVQVRRYIYYMITKDKYYEKPTLCSLRQSLVATREHCVKHGVRHLAMPQIGCGLDRLLWTEVRGTICDVFASTHVQITIYILNCRR